MSPGALPRTPGSPSGRRPQTGSTTIGAIATAGRPAAVAARFDELHEPDGPVVTMTDQEVARFALQLREAERIRAQIAQDNAADEGGELRPPITPPAEHTSAPVVAAT